MLWAESGKRIFHYFSNVEPDKKLTLESKFMRRKQKLSEIHLDRLQTETRNERTKELDQMTIHEMLRLMNQEDQSVPRAIEKELPIIEKAIKAIIHSFEQGGRLIYMGAGTSGRLGVLDAAEGVPTFSV